MSTRARARTRARADDHRALSLQVQNLIRRQVLNLQVCLRSSCTLFFLYRSTFLIANNYFRPQPFQHASRITVKLRNASQITLGSHKAPPQRGHSDRLSPRERTHLPHLCHWHYRRRFLPVGVPIPIQVKRLPCRTTNT